MPHVGVIEEPSPPEEERAAAVEAARRSYRRRLGGRHLHRQRGCTDKARLTLAESLGLSARLGCRRYRCRYCDGWHLTSR